MLHCLTFLPATISDHLTVGNNSSNVSDVRTHSDENLSIFSVVASETCWLFGGLLNILLVLVK